MGNLIKIYNLSRDGWYTITSFVGLKIRVTLATVGALLIETWWIGSPNHEFCVAFKDAIGAISTLTTYW